MTIEQAIAVIEDRFEQLRRQAKAERPNQVDRWKLRCIENEWDLVVAFLEAHKPEPDR